MFTTSRLQPPNSPGIRGTLGWYFAIGLALVLATSTLHAQAAHDVCADSCCRTDVLILNTGYNHATNLRYNPVTPDGYWHITQDPNPANGPVPRNATVINQTLPWPGALWNTRYIAGTPTSTNNFLGQVRFDNCFCVCDSGIYAFDLAIIADDSATVLVDGIVIGTTPNPGFGIPLVRISSNRILAPGVHCLQVWVDNTLPQHSGFDLRGTVQGPGLVRYECCSPTETVPVDSCDTNRVTLASDGSWNIVSGPPEMGPFPRCADEISRHANWGTELPGTHWISISPDGLTDTLFGDYVYRKCFCVRQAGVFTISLSVMGDDAVDVAIDGTTILSVPNYAASTPAGRILVIALDSGCHCFDFTVHDEGAVETGLNALVNITGSGLAKPECCLCDTCFNPQFRAHRGPDAGNDGRMGMANETGTASATETPKRGTMLTSIPNPTTGETVVHYTLDHATIMRLELYGANGELLTVIDEGPRAAGEHLAPLRRNGLAAGAYRIQLVYGKRVMSIPLTVQ